MRFQLEGDRLNVFVDKSAFTDDVLYKCFYWYGGEFDVSIINDTSSETKVSLKIRQSKDIDFEATISKIKQDLVDFKLRDIVTKETQTIRELIIAKAFAYYDVEEPPTTQVSDPVGFDPLMID